MWRRAGRGRGRGRGHRAHLWAVPSNQSRPREFDPRRDILQAKKKESGMKIRRGKFNIASGEKIFPLQTENEARTVEVFEGRMKAISETEAEIKAVSRT